MDAATSLTDWAGAALAACAQTASAQSGLLLGMLAMGLAGGITHCAGMCGPFVLSQVATRLAAVPAAGMSELHRLAGAAALPYHLGRAITYAALGAAGALAAQGAIAVTGFRWLAAALLAVAAVLLLGHAWARIGALGASGRRAEPPGRVAAMVQRLTRPLFDRPFAARGLALGLVLGFLPCGLLYAAIAAASASGDPLAGALGMVVFALGTAPGLVGVGLVGHAALRRWRAAAPWAAPALLTANAVMLGGIALRLVA